MYRMVPLSTTLIDPDRDFKVAISIDIEYLRNDKRYSHSYYRTLSNDDIFNDLDGPLTRFSRSRHF